MKTLIYNSVYCSLCGETIQSYHRHDFKYCSCKNAMVDGGLDYSRWGWDKPNTVFNHCLYLEDHPFSIIRQYYYRWNFNTEKYITLMDISDEWLDAILEFYIPGPTQKAKMRDVYLLLFLEEKLYRSEQED